MSIEINQIQELKTYFNGVMNRADHHADNVNEVVLALIGGVIWKSDSFKVREYNGSPANILWMEINDKRYCFKFNHFTGNIEVCENGHGGNVIMTFNNSNTLQEIKAFFDSL